jgi:hypothetical protein
MRHRQPRQEARGHFEIVEPFIHGDTHGIVLACDRLEMSGHGLARETGLLFQVTL